MVLPARALLGSIVAVAMAAGGYFLTQPESEIPQAKVVTSTPSATATPTSKTPVQKPKKLKKKAPKLVKGDVYVEVYNNSGINGLAGSTSARAQGYGWNVVGTDNWVGTVPSTTVYFPTRLKVAGQRLAKDLGIARVMPAIDPMRGDRLTVIITGDYS